MKEERWFYRSAKKGNGLHSMCKVCQDRATHRARARVKVVPVKEKRCARCMRVQDASAFPRRSCAKTGLASWCKACKKAWGIARKRTTQPLHDAWSAFIAKRLPTQYLRA